MIEQTTLHNILTWIIAVILFIFQSLNYFISQIKKIVKHGQKNTTVVTTDTIILSESNPNNNNAPENVITVQGLIQKHFDIPLIISEDEQKVNDFIKNAQLLTSYENYKEKKKIDQFMEHLVDDSYVARGLGLITANVGREAEFYLYSKYDNNFDNVVIKLKGRQGEIGQITIPNQNSTNSIDTKSIPMDYFYDEDRIKVTYTPFAEGVYTLTLVRNGLSICRSPYYISVEKSPTNSRSQIRLGTKKYKMVTKFSKAKHVPLETCDNSSPLIEPSKPSISRNILSTPEENSIRTDVMSIVTKFESNSIHFQKNDQKPRVNTSKKSTKTDLFDKISISADSNTQPEIETGNDYDTNINDLSSLSINSNSKSNDKKCSSNLDVSNRNSKSNYVDSIEIESNLLKKSNKKLDESIRNINDIPRVKNISSNHLEPTNSALLKESLNDKSLDDVEKRNKTYKTNEPILGQNQIETFLDPIAVVKSEIKCIDNEACTHNEVSCFDDNDRKTEIVKKNINELETHPNISMNQQFTDSTQYNINTTFTSVLTKITNDVCEKCSIKVLRILSEFSRDINITHNNNSNENCSSFETLLAQPISIHINIDNLFEKPISPTNEHKTNNLLINSPINMKLMDTTDKDIKYHYINEIKPIDTTFNEIYCDINNTTTELMVKQNKHNGEIKKTINDKITNDFTIPLTKNNIDKSKTDHIENIFSTDNKMQIQVQNVQKSSDHNMDKDKTNQIQFHEYINNELNNINKENCKILDKFDNIVTINNEKKSNEELVTKELKAKNVIISDEYKNIQSSFINSQTVLASMEDKLPTSRYKPEDIRQEISNISNTNVILPENQKLIIENSIEPVLKSFKNEMVEKITQLYLNKDLASSENTSILENLNINLTNNLQKKQLHHNADKNKTKLTETIRSQLKNHFHINDISGMILNNKKTDNNQLYKFNENIIKTNMNPNKIHSQRLDEINFQTLESIAKNQLNKQQLVKESKIMILESVTPNFERKKTIDDEKVQDPKIKLKNIPNGTSTKIKATTKTIKSNTSKETDVESNIDNKKKVRKIVVEIVTNNNKMIVDSIAIIIHEETEENKQVAKNNTPKPNYWRQINDHEEYTINAYNDAIKPTDKDKVIETEMTKISIKTDITIGNNLKDTNEKEIEESIKHDLITETPIIPVQKSEKVENINQTKIIQYIDSSTKHIKEPINVEIFYKQKILKNDVQANKTKQNIKKENESCLLIDTSNVPVEQNNIIRKSIEHPISMENSNESVKESKVTKATTETELMKNRNSLALNKEESINKENNPETEIETQISINNTIKESEPISLIKTPTFSDNEKIIIKKKIEKLINYFKDSKEVDIKTESESILKNDNSIANIEEPIDNDDIPETVTRTKKSKNKIYKVNDPCSPSDIPTTSDEEKIILEETAENLLLNESPIKSVDDINVIDINSKYETTLNNDSPTQNVEEPIDIDVIPETETLTDISTDHMNTESETYSLPDITTTSNEEKIILEETVDNRLPNEPPIKSVKVEPSQNNDSKIENVDEPNDINVIQETETQIGKSTDKMNTESETCTRADITTTSDEEKIILEETAENLLLNESPIKSVDDINVIDIYSESETTLNNDSPTENVEAPIDQDIIPATETQTEKSNDKMNTESETCSRADIPTIYDEDKRTIVETAEKPLLIDQPTKSIEIETTTNTDSPTENVEEPIAQDIIPEIATQTVISTDNVNTDSETYSLPDITTTSDEEKIILEETVDNRLPNETPIKSVKVEPTPNTDSKTENVDETNNINVIQETETQIEKSRDRMNTESETCSRADIPTISDEEERTLVETTEKPLLSDQPTKSIEIETTPNTDSPTENVEQPIDQDIISATETQIEKTTDTMNTKSETCSRADIPTISDEEEKTLVETTEKPLLSDQPTKSIEIETTPNTDSPTENVEQPIDQDIISATETQIEKTTDTMNTKSETCSRADIPTISDKEERTLVETTEKPLLSDQPTKSVEIETTPNTDSPTENVEQPIDQDIISATETQIEKTTDTINTKSETCSRADISTISDEDKRTIVETTEKPLLNDQPTKSIEIETTLNTDYQTENVEEPIDIDVIKETETLTDISTDHMNTESETYSLPDITTTSDEEKIILEETVDNRLPNAPPIKSVKVEPSQYNDSKIENVDEPNDINVIQETETQIGKSTDKMNTESETCTRADITTTSDEEKIILEETAENLLLNESPIKSVDDINVIDINSKYETTLNNDSQTENVEEPIDQDIIPATETQTEKSNDKMNTESETCSRADIPTIYDEDKRTIVETAEKPLLIDQPTKSIKIETTTNTDSPTVNVEKPIDKDIIPEIATQTEKSKYKIYKGSEPCLPTDIPTTSDEEKIILEETAFNPILNEASIKSVDEIKVIDINTEIKTSTNTDSPTVNVEEPVDKDIISETETQTEKSKYKMNTESETCSRADIPTTSDEEKRTLVETTEKPLLSDQPTKSIEIETTPNTDSPTENVEQPIDQDIISATETQKEKTTDTMITKSETCSRADIPTISDEEERTLVETTEKPLLSDQPTKSIEIETTPNTDSPTENVEQPIDQDIISATETQIEKTTDTMNTKSETCSWADIPTISDEEEKTLVETTEKPLLSDQPTKSIEIETTPNTDSPTENVEQPIDQDIISATETQIEKTTDTMNTKSETCSRADIPTISDKEERTLVETTEKPLLSDQPTKSVEIETTPNTDSPTENVEQPIDQDIISATETQIEKTTDTINTKSETCSRADISTISDEDKRTIVETTEKPLLNDQPTKSIEIETTLNTDYQTENVEEPIDIDVIKETETLTDISTDHMNTESETYSLPDITTTSDEEKIILEETVDNRLPNAPPIKSVKVEPSQYNDSKIENVDEPNDINVIQETETQIGKSTDKMNTESETCTRADITTTSDEEKIILEETAENLLLNESPIKSVDDINVIDINSKYETTLNNDSQTENVEEPIDQDIIPATETQTEKSNDKMNTESETCSRADIPTIYDEDKRTIVETAEKPLLIDQPTKSIKIETTTNTDSPTVNVEKPIDKDIIPEIATQTEKSKYKIYKGSEPCLPTDIPTTSDEEKIILEETAFNPILNEASIKSVDEIKVIDINTEIKTSTNTDSPTVNVEEPVDKDIISETETQTEKSKYKMNTESETCSRADIPTTSDEEKRTLVETTEKPLLSDQPTKSIEIETTPNTDSPTENVEQPIDQDIISATETQKEKTTDTMITKSETCSRADIPTISDEEERTLVETTEKPLLSDQPTKSIEIETTPNTDSPTENVEQPIDQDIISATETQIEKTTDTMNTKSETCSWADIPTISDEEEKTLVETTEKPLLSDQPTKSIEIETTPNTDSPTENVEQPIDQDIISATETQIEKTTDTMNTKSETCSRADIPTISDKEERTLVETTEKPLLSDQPTKSVEIETTPNTDSPTENVEQPIDQDIISATETQIEKTTDTINTKSETCSRADISTISDEDKRTIVETTEKPLLNDQPTKSIEIETTLNTDYQTENVEEPIDIDVIKETETLTDISTDHMNTESETYSLPDITTTSDEEKIILEETVDNRLPNAPPIKSVKVEPSQYNDSKIENVDEPNDINVIQETETQIGKSTDKMNTESETCTRADITTTSDEEKIILEETAENLLLNESPIKSVDDINVIDINSKYETTLNNDSQTENVEEPIDQDIIPATETQTEKSNDKMNTESETCSRADIPTIYDEDKRTIVETAEKPLLIDQPTKSIKIETTTNTDSPTVNVEKPIDKDIIPEIATQTEKSKYKIYKGSEPCLPTDIPTTSDEEKIILEETAFNPILNEASIKSVDEIKVIDINTEIKTSTNTDSPTVNVEEPVDKDIISETETQTEKSKYKMNTESETCSRADIPTTSDEEKRTLVETTEKPLLSDQPTKSIEIETTPNTDSPTENVEQPIDQDIISATETQKEKTTDTMITKSETCSRADIPTISDEEEITLVETTENPLLSDQPTKSIEIETTPNTDSQTENVEEPIDIDVIPESETLTDILTDHMNTESETYSLPDITTTSDEEKIILEETVDNRLPNEPPIKSVKVEPSQYNDSKIENVDEPNDINVIQETETQIGKSTDKMNTESETCTRADITTTSDEEKIILEETAENLLLNESPIKSVDDISVIDIYSESETTLNNDSPTENVEAPIDQDIIPATETQTEKSNDKMNTESETCSRADIPTIYDEDKRTIVETAEKPLLIDQPTKSIEIETTTNTDSPTVNVEKPIDKDIIPEIATQTEKSKYKIYKGSEPCLPTDIPTTSDEEKIILEETADNPILNEASIKSVDEIKVIDINTEIKTSTNTDSPTVNVEEPVDKDIISETETQTEKSKYKMNTESETCSRADIPTISDEEKSTLVETTEMPLLNDQPTKSIEIETTPNTDSPTENVEQPIDQDIISATETQIEKTTDTMNTKSETCSRADIPTISDEEERTLVETTEKPLLSDQPTKSIEIETTPNTDSQTENVEEPIDIDVIPETETLTDILTDHMNTESETYSLPDITTTSDEAKVILEETVDNRLPNEPPIKSVKVEPTPNTDSQTENVEEPIDIDVIPETETQTDISTDHMNTESETYSPADITTTSDEEKIILEETAENLLLNESPIKSVDDINVIDINSESETTLNNDSSIANVEEPINKDNVPETQIEIFKTIDNIEKESETCSHTDTSSFYIDEKNIIDETVSNPLQIETIIKSIEEVKVVDINTESKSLLNNDSSITNVGKPAENSNTADNPLLIEPPFKSEDEIKVIYINTEIETTPNTDPPTVNVEEMTDKDIISETQTQTGKSKDNINIEREPCSPFDTPTVFGEEKIMIVETTEKLLLNETPIKSSEKFKVVDINTKTEPSPNTDSFLVNVEALIEKENIREFQIETDKLIDNSNNECESCFPTDKLSASDEGNNLTKETIEVLSPIEISIKSSIKSVEESKVKKVNTETVFVPNTDSLKLNAEEPLYEDYFSKIVIKTDKILDFIVKGCETCPPVDTSMYAREEIKGIDGTIEKLIPISPSFVVEETENLTSIDGFNTIVNTQSGKEYLKDIESATRIDTAAFVKDQKVEENETVIENILTINTSAASVQAQIQVEEVIKDKSVILINDSDTFYEMSPEEQKKIETVNISSITVIEEQTDINRGDVIYTCEESLDKTIVEKDIHSETTSTIDILAADVEEKRALEIELSEYATQVLNDTSTETIENPIKTKKNTENEMTTPIVVAKSEVEKNEIKVMIENETSTPVHLASTNTEQTETDMVTEIASPNVNILNSNTKIILIDKEMITENSNNPKHCYLKFGETSKIHRLENEDNLPEKSYGIQKLEMSVQRMKTSNEDYYEKTFLQLEQTEKISVENKDKVDCENKNIIDDKLYTVNESDLNAILCASSLEEALTLLDSKIKFKFKHRKLSNKANSTPHIPKIQTSESRSSGTNTNFTDAREFFKEIEKKCKK